MAAQLHIGLKRNTPAFFLGAGDKILINRSRFISKRGRQHLERQACANCADQLGAAIVICFAPVTDQGEGHVRRSIRHDHAAQAIVLVAIDLGIHIRRDIIDIAVILAVEANKAAAD